MPIKKNWNLILYNNLMTNLIARCRLIVDTNYAILAVMGTKF